MKLGIGCHSQNLRLNRSELWANLQLRNKKTICFKKYNIQITYKTYYTGILRRQWGRRVISNVRQTKSRRANLGKKYSMFRRRSKMFKKKSMKSLTKQKVAVTLTIKSQVCKIKQTNLKLKLNRTHKNCQICMTLVNGASKTTSNCNKKNNFNTQNYYEILLDSWEEITDENGDEFLELIFKVQAEDFDELQVWAPSDYYSDQLQSVLQEDNNSDTQFYEKIEDVLTMLGIEVTMGVIDVNNFKNDEVQLEIRFQNGETYVFCSVVAYGIIIIEVLQVPLYITKNVAKQFCSN
eukprot:TRINITY_DN2266_c0_g1_i13.p1 TRINITY_DN2266_c0_g1~~TRINITY_DN2266_c0_g1_i13.p1  ORF type:complete len:293 (+),score=15.19 TRINITY_DN2266_c0_g1_i13:389-1267(+)